MKKSLILIPALFSSFISLGFINRPVNIVKSVTEVSTIGDLRSTSEEIKEYYSALDGKDLKGDEFLSALQEILKENQTKCDYSGKSGKSKSKIWDTYLLADRNFDKSPLTTEEINKINEGDPYWWDTDLVYCNVLYEEEPYKFDRQIVNQNIEGQEEQKIDREHIYPKSYGFNGANGNNDAYKDMLAGCDMHNLHMGEGTSNQNYHGNLPYGNVSEIDKQNKDNIAISSLSGTVGSYKGTHEVKEGTTSYTKEVFEPIDKDKGDIARSIFYMAARYHNYEENVIGETYPTPRLLLSDFPNDPKDGTHEPGETKDTDIAYGVLSDLIEWNELDKVTESEKLRNDLVYKYIQHNRNPFIDFPKWVDIAFNPDTEYVINLNSEDGVSLAFEANISFGNNINTYALNEPIDFSNLVMTYTLPGEDEKTIDYTNLNLDITNRLNDKVIYSNYDMSKPLTLEEGYYKFNFALKENNEYSLDVEVKVGDCNINYVVDFSSIPETQNLFKPLNLSAINGTISIGNTTKNLSYSDLSIKLLNANKEEINISGDNIRLSFGNYSIEASYTDFLGESHSLAKDFKVGFVLDALTIAIIVIAIVIIVILIILIATKNHKKNKRKTKKSNR